MRSREEWADWLHDFAYLHPRQDECCLIQLNEKADEILSAITLARSLAVESERERCIKAECDLCASGDKGFEQDGLWMHEYDDTLFGVTERKKCGCNADPIRRLSPTPIKPTGEGKG